MARVDYSELKRAVTELNQAIEKMESDGIDFDELKIPKTPLKIVGTKKEALVDSFAERVEAIDDADLIDYLPDFVPEFYENLPPKEFDEEGNPVNRNTLTEGDPRRKTHEEEKAEKRIEETNNKIKESGEKLDARAARIANAKAMAKEKARNLAKGVRGNYNRSSSLYMDGPIEKGVRDPFEGGKAKHIVLIEEICKDPMAKTSDLLEVIGEKVSRSNTEYIQSIVLKTIFILSLEGKMKDEFRIENPFKPTEE